MESLNNSWQMQNDTLTRTFKFKDFHEAIAFINKIAEIANRLDHHPQIENMYNTVTLTLSTHEAGDKVTEKDKEFAREVDNL